MASVKEKILFFISAILYVIPIILGFVGFFIVISVNKHPFDDQELKELKEFYNMKPLVNIIKSNNSHLFNETYYPLFGKYKGLNGGHIFKKCDYLFSGTCRDAEKRNIECPTDHSDFPSKLDWDTCKDYTPIPEFNYTYYIDDNESYFYGEKTKNNYEALSEISISEQEKCPEKSKKCGLLNKGLILCYNIEAECPINDIVINQKPEYLDNNILYKTIKLNEKDYIHFTNEKTNNQIILDLIISVEHPLSKLEITEEDKTEKIFQVNRYENNYYYNGSINNIKSLKQIYNTNINYTEFMQLYNIYDIIISEPIYETKYFSSNMFIYKKYSVPILHATYQEIETFNKDYFVSCILFYISIGLIFLSGILPTLFYCWDHRIYIYIPNTVVQLLIIVFFIVFLYDLK